MLIGCSSQPVLRDSSIPLTTVNSVDIERYLGRWYEIARLPNQFEKNCEGVTADYSRRDDGLISVINSCRLGSTDGKLKVAKGRARIVDTASNAKLEVSFFGPFWGDYWILELDDDYELALVGEPSGKYLWVLSRAPKLHPEVLAATLNRLKDFGYETDKLYYPKQPPA